jgi:glucose-1-phosphate thymidylyltransferase long form
VMKSMQAVILAGGEGCRLRPLTYARPKAMIPLANRPIIDYVIDALVANGIRDIMVVAGYRKEQMIRHLNERDLPIRVVVQEKQLGAMHALACAQSEIQGDFIVLPGDNYVDATSIAKIKDFKNAMLVKNHPHPSNFGVVVVKEGRVKEIIEKPEHAPSFTVSTGIFHLDTTVFEYYCDNEIPEVIDSMIRDDMKIRALYADEWHDAVYPWDLLHVNASILRNRHSVRAGKISSGVRIQGSVQIGAGTEIGPNTTITGPVVIGENCSIAANTCIMPNTSVGSRVSLEPFCFIQNSLIMDDVHLGSHSRCTDSIIGEGVRLSDHTTTQTGYYAAEERGRLIKGKFGAIIGDRVSSSPFTVFRHCIIGNNVTIDEGRTLTSFIPDNTVVK